MRELKYEMKKIHHVLCEYEHIKPHQTTQPLKGAISQETYALWPPFNNYLCTLIRGWKSMKMYWNKVCDVRRFLTLLLTMQHKRVYSLIHKADSLYIYTQNNVTEQIFIVSQVVDIFSLVVCNACYVRIQVPRYSLLPLKCKKFLLLNVWN